MPSIAQNIYDAAHSMYSRVTGHPELDLDEVLNETIRAFVKSPYAVSRGLIHDSTVTDELKVSTVIYLADEVGSPDASDLRLNVNSVACAIHVVRCLGEDELREAYNVIGRIKRMKRTFVAARRPASTDTPMGIVFAVHANRPMEDLALHVQRLNGSSSSTEWPDMIVVLNIGTLTYAVQFPCGTRCDDAGCGIVRNTLIGTATTVPRAVQTHIGWERNASLAHHLPYEYV